MTSLSRILKLFPLGKIFPLGVLAAAAQCAPVPVIGLATSSGNITLNGAKIAGNTNVFEGSTLETQTAASTVHLQGGGTLELDAHSRGKLLRNAVVLYTGAATVTAYAATVNGIRIVPGLNSAARVVMRSGSLQVAALSGRVPVFSPGGVNVANLLPGRALSLREDPMAEAAITGCAFASGKALLLTDEATNVTVELRGLHVNAGERVTIHANPRSGTATDRMIQVVQVKSFEKQTGACIAPTGAAAALAGPAAAAATVGAATAATAAAESRPLRP